MPRARALTRSSPRAEMHRAWQAFHASHFDQARGRARRASSAERRRPDPYARLGLFLLGSQLRGEVPTSAQLRHFWLGPEGTEDAEAALLARAWDALATAHQGGPLSRRARRFQSLARTARRLGSPLYAPLEVRLARTQLDLGRLRAAEASARRAQQVVHPQAALALVLQRAAAALRGRGPLGPPPDLEGLPPPERTQAALVLARTHLRLGQHPEAKAWLVDAARRNAPRRGPAAAAEIRQLRARLLLAQGAWDAAAAQLGPRAPRGAGRGLALGRRVLRARLDLARGEARTARRTLHRALPDLTRHGEVALLREAQAALRDLLLDGPTGAATWEDLAQAWEDAAGWEEETDRLVLATRVLAAPCPARLRRRVLRDLRDQDTPRARSLVAAHDAGRALARGDQAAARLARLQVASPPLEDLPDLELRRALDLVDPRRAEESAAPAPTSPATARRLVQLGRRLHGAGPVTARLVTRDRVVELDRWDAARVLADRDRWPLWLAPGRGEARASGVPLELARRGKQVELLAMLMRRAPASVGLDELLEEIWQRPYVAYESDKVVYTTVNRLRRDLPDRGWIQTVEGRYQLDPELRWGLWLEGAGG